MSSGCGDVLTLQDLKTAKLHQTFEAEVITGRSGGVSTGASIDYAVNQITGQTQKTMPAILRDVGFEPASFDFTSGGTLTTSDANKTVYDPVSKTWYSWAGSLPKVIPPGTNPLSDLDWKPRTDPNLRDDLASNTNANLGDALIGVKSDLATSTPRTQHGKNKDVISVFDFGAVGDGTTDASTAFSNAAKAIVVADISQADYVGVPHAPYGEVIVPAGVYLLSSLVDVGGRNITWIVDGGARFINPNNLNGRISRAGVKINNFNMAGTIDGACGFSVANYRNAETPGGVLGVTAPNQLAVYTDRDTVGLYADNLAPPILASTTTGTYTLTGVSLSGPLTSDQIKKLRVGMIIDTKHTPTKYTGVITGWAADGSSINVEGWYLADGLNSVHPKVTPPNAIGFNVNPFTKAWALNANVFINSSSYASAVAGFELGVGNDKFDYDSATDSWHMWGYDVITLGSKLCETGYMQRGYFYKGYESRGAIGYNFLAANSSGIWANQAVYGSTANSDFQILVKPDAFAGKTSFAVKKEGNVELGRTDAAQTTLIDFHSSGNDIDYDARISVQGGTSTIGQGNVTFTGGQFFWSTGYAMDASVFRPTTDAGRNLGNASFRFNTVYASTGSINTSDERQKTFFDIDVAEREAAKAIKGLIRKFKFNSSIEEKEDSARYHFGVGAQSVRDILLSHGLNPGMYAFLCYDEWEDVYKDIIETFDVEKEVTGDVEVDIVIDGQKVGTRTEQKTYTVVTKEERVTGKELIKAAGNAYGIRYDELICFIISAM